jgi:hypothetical protein
MAEISTGAFTRTDRFGDRNDPTFPEFFIEAVPDELASNRQGYPIYRDEERVRIHMPGNNLSIPVEKVNEEHRQRWPEHYRRFKSGQEMAHDGTPLEMWPAISSKSQVLFLKHHDIHTIEQMAHVSDYNLTALGMGARQLRDLAKAFLDSAQRNAMTKALMSENEKLAVELIEAKQQITELKGLMNQMQVQIEGLANRPHMAHHIPGQHDPFAAVQGAPTVTEAAPADPLASFAAVPATSPAAA